MSETVTLSIIVPSLGRPSLAAALDSLLPRLGLHDEIVVCADETGDVRFAESEADRVGAVFLTAPHGEGVGCSQRNAAIAAATGSHLVFLDDDDVFTEDALSLFSRRAEPDRPVIFRMRFGMGQTLWLDRAVRFCNVGTPMFCVPNLPGLVPLWRPHVGDQGADFQWISEVVELQGQPVFREEVVCDVKPPLGGRSSP